VTEIESTSRLKVTEVFYSLQGETDRVGLPTVFIRLTGCPLRCHYCDTAYAFHGGQYYTIADLLDKAKSYPTQYVTVTGGEPLAQKACFALLSALCDAGFDVSLETSGAIPMTQLDPRVIKIMDIKTPDSGEVARNHLANLDLLSSKDQVKFVLCSEADFQWAIDFIGQYALASRCQLLFSPSYDQLPAEQLANWILAKGLPVRMQVQLHKYLWGNQPGR
jgi:7-carboxy-7-deazaguanine synthase